MPADQSGAQSRDRRAGRRLGQVPPEPAAGKRLKGRRGFRPPHLPHGHKGTVSALPAAFHRRKHCRRPASSVAESKTFSRGPFSDRAGGFPF